MILRQAKVIRRPQLSLFEKGCIYELRKTGKSLKFIAYHFKRSKQTICSVLNKMDELQTFERLPGSGRPRIFDENEEAQIQHMAVLKVKRGENITAEQIQRESNEIYKKKASERTIRRVLSASEELRSCWQTRKAFVSEKNRKKRLKFAKEHLSWTSEDWGRVIWSDESPFVYRYNKRQRVWSLTDPLFHKTKFLGTVKHDKKNNVWGCFSRHSVGKLYQIEGIMKKEDYHNILQRQLIPSTKTLFPDGNFIFQEDNDPKHSSRLCRGYLESKNINRMEWPAQSPDLNPIENLWAILNGKAKDRRPKSDQELFGILENEWNKLDKTILTNLVDSMPNRCRLVIKHRGMPIDY